MTVKRLVIGRGLIATVGVLLAVWRVGLVRADGVRGLSAAAVQAMTPDGYKLAKHIPWRSADGDQEYRVAAFGDANDEEPTKPVTVLLLAWRRRWVVCHSVLPHHDARPGASDYDAPNYFTDVSRVRVDGQYLILLRTMVFGGGSGSLQYFDFYDVRSQKLVLVRSFSHGRMERYYFALYGDSIYDADLVCKRGEQHGRSFVHTCYLDVTKYAFDGKNIAGVRSERLHERQGPWFLCDSYRFMSVKKALENREVFADVR